ncbi:MAG: type VI secretion system tube protein Hcp [Gammaproteobacteria bacterium]|nr:type VI secretion system tube protein Hcp [Gammaproteobacteria bacterium]
MAVDMFLTFDEGAKIKGETQDKAFKTKHGIDVLAWSWGMSQSGTTHMGEGGGSGKANFQDLSFTHYVDMASCDLMAASATGKHINKATLTVRKAGDKPLEYIVITMDEVIVTSVSTGGSGREERLTENVTLNFAKVKMEYKAQSKTGGEDKAGQFTWDIAANNKD